MRTFRKFLKSKAGKAQVVSEAAWVVALALAFHLKSIQALEIVAIFGAGIACVFMSYGFWKSGRKVKKQ